MKISQWPLHERPREKLLSQGAKTLTEAELLSILLRLGTPGKTALDLARELLAEFGGLKKMILTEPQQLYRLSGLGKAKYALLQAAIELGKRYQAESVQVGEKLGNSLATQRFLTAKLRDYPREIFACLFLNAHNRILAYEELFQGSLTEANVYPREVVKRALAHNCAKVILAHNHPSGNATPSQADIQLTQQLKQALALVEIQVIDHVIVGQQENFSFAQAGWL